MPNHNDIKIWASSYFNATHLFDAEVQHRKRAQIKFISK